MSTLRSRKLLWRLVLFGVIELIVIVGVSAARFYFASNELDGAEIAEQFGAKITAAREDRKALNEVLQQIDREHGVETAFLDTDGRIVAIGRDPREDGLPGRPGRPPMLDGPPMRDRDRPGPPPLDRGPPGMGLGVEDWLRPRPGARPHVIRVPISTSHGVETLVIRRSRRAPQGGELWALAVIVFVVAGVALLFARDLALPLEKLAATARAFGQGNLSARNNLRRKDELGEVAEAFDEMAAKVQTLLQSQRELLANVSHELRTPLSRIQVALDIAAEGDAELARESLTGIGEDLAELNSLIDDILAAARLESADATGVPPLRKEELALKPLLLKVGERFSTRHKHRLEQELAVGDDVVLEGDPILLRRAFDNLLDNAGKYSEATATVTLSAKVVERSVVVAVTDRGVGMDEEELRQLFTPFYRSDKSRARKTGGVGLGLVLARRVIEAHGGQLTAASKPGQGTTMTATLPIRA